MVEGINRTVTFSRGMNYLTTHLHLHRCLGEHLLKLRTGRQPPPLLHHHHKINQLKGRPVVRLDPANQQLKGSSSILVLKATVLQRLNLVEQSLYLLATRGQVQAHLPDFVDNVTPA